MKLIVAGSRDLDENYAYFKFKEFWLHFNHPVSEFVSGTARGADKLGEDIAKTLGYKVTRMPANWDKYGKSAGYIRNGEMADYADYAVILWNGESKGSLNMAEQMKKRGKPYVILTCKKKGS